MAEPEKAKLLRLLDVNANRAREALRVLEDYARFVLNDSSLSGRLKSLRHDLTGATRSWLSDAIIHRDTPGDVGTTLTTPAEQHRENLDAVVTAAGKRLGEALRSLEEFSKTFDPTAARTVESIRYRFYDIEQAIARTLRTDRRFDAVRLYVLITESSCRGDWLKSATAAIEGGADAVQLREKNLESGELLRRAKILVALCRQHGVLCIINDRPDIAVLSEAEGVHIGQGDLPAIEARKIVGGKKIVGVSTHNIAQAKKAVLDGADYIGVGPVFRSTTKPRNWDEIPGLSFAAEAAEKIKIPAVAIAGINSDNVDEVLATGVKCVAVTAAITDCDDVRAATISLKQKLLEGG